MELKHYFAFLRRWAWLLIIGALIGALIAYANSVRQPRIYEATTTLMVDNRLPVDRTSPNYEALRVRDRLAITYAALLSRRLVLEETITNLNLSFYPGELAAKMTVVPVEGTELIKLSVRDPDPSRAALIADEIVRVFNQQEAGFLLNPYAGYTQSLRVVDEAQPRWIPVSPTPQRDMTLAAFIGFCIALVIGYLWDYFDDRLKTREDIKRLTGLNAIASIDRLPGREPADRVVVITETDKPVAEAYRLFRATLEQVAESHTVRTIAITSSLPMEGKSTTAANLAVALAQTGKRVILVDTDLRNAMIHTLFRRDNLTGLTNALSQEGAWKIEDYLVPTNIENLSLLFSGKELATTSRLLGADRFVEFVDQLKNHADVILFDCPALLESVDASLVLRVSDATLMVVRAVKTRARHVNQARELVAQTGSLLIGAWLNHVAHRYRSYGDHRNQPQRRRRLRQRLQTQTPASTFKQFPSRAHSAIEAEE